MSEAEFDRLIAGERLTNTTDFHGEQGKRTTSVGFCFFPEDPDEAIHWLSGIVTTDRCVTLDIPDELLTESTGKYRDPDIEKARMVDLRNSLTQSADFLKHRKQDQSHLPEEWSDLKDGEGESV